MNRQTADVWMTLAQSPSTNQRELAGCAGMSLGAVNKALLELRRQGIVTETGQLSAAGSELLADNRPRRAILLAAGPGMRMVPINQQAPKPLLEVEIPEHLPFTEAQRSILRQILSLDPRPAYQDSPEKEYAMPFEGADVQFRVQDGKVIVTDYRP